jgi:hypothetical protein
MTSAALSDTSAWPTSNSGGLKAARSGKQVNGPFRETYPPPFPGIRATAMTFLLPMGPEAASGERDDFVTIADEEPMGLPRAAMIVFLGAVAFLSQALPTVATAQSARHARTVRPAEPPPAAFVDEQSTWE